MVTRIQSKVKSVNDLVFHPIPTHPVNVARAVRVGGDKRDGKSGVTVFVGTDGRVYSTGVRASVTYTQDSTGDRLWQTLAGCQKLGLLSAEAVRQHKAHAEETAKRNALEYAAECFGKEAQAIGIKLTAAQKRHAQKLLGGGKVARSAARIADAGLA
jgi:hypothetical protein